MYLLSGKDPESASSLVQDKCAQKPAENSKLGNKAACLHVDRAENLTELGEKWLLSHSKLKQLIRPGSNLLPDSSGHKRLGNAFWESCLETAARCKAWVFEAIKSLSSFLYPFYLKRTQHTLHLKCSLCAKTSILKLRNNREFCPCCLQKPSSW